MRESEMKTEKVPVELPNGAVINIEVSESGREDVAFDTFPFDDIGVYRLCYANVTTNTEPGLCSHF